MRLLTRRRVQCDEAAGAPKGAGAMRLLTRRSDRADREATPTTQRLTRAAAAARRRTRATLILSAGFLALVALVSVLAPWITWHDPLDAELVRRLQPPGWLDGGSWSYPLGTDSTGRDLFTRMLFGVRLSLLIGLAAVACGGVIGVTAGILAGYYDEKIAAVGFGRVADIQQAIPFVVLALAVVASIGPSFQNLILILGVGSWLFYYRIVRGEVLKIRRSPTSTRPRPWASPTRASWSRTCCPTASRRSLSSSPCSCPG